MTFSVERSVTTKGASLQPKFSMTVLVLDSSNRSIDPVRNRLRLWYVQRRKSRSATTSDRVSHLTAAGSVLEATVRRPTTMLVVSDATSTAQPKTVAGTPMASETLTSPAVESVGPSIVTRRRYKNGDRATPSPISAHCTSNPPTRTHTHPLHPHTSLHTQAYTHRHTQCHQVPESLGGRF